MKSRHIEYIKLLDPDLTFSARVMVILYNAQLIYLSICILTLKCNPYILNLNKVEKVVKRKPREFPPFVPSKPADWILWGVFILARSYETGVEGIRRFQCSNPDCGKETVFNARNTWLPPGCMYCGNEFDWEGIFIEKAKIRPSDKSTFIGGGGGGGIRPGGGGGITTCQFEICTLIHGGGGTNPNAP
jgi:hypothetical protein